MKIKSRGNTGCQSENGITIASIINKRHNQKQENELYALYYVQSFFVRLKVNNSLVKIVSKTLSPFFFTLTSYIKLKLTSGTKYVATS